MVARTRSKAHAHTAVLHLYTPTHFTHSHPPTLQSFETELEIVSPELLGDTKCHGVFIRAPAILKVNSPDVEILARLTPEQMPELRDGPYDCIVAARQNNLLVTAFHVSARGR